VGKSVLAMNLAVYFAQLGKSVVLVDADATGACLHIPFGLGAANLAPPLTDEADSFASHTLNTKVPGLAVLPHALDTTAAPLILRAARKSRYVARLRALPADYVVVDAGPGTSHLPVDLSLSADLPICVTTPEPAALETTYRFFRAVFVRRMRRTLAREKLKSTLFERALRELGGLPSPYDIVTQTAKIDRPLAELAWHEARRTSLLLVVNQTRVRADIELAGSMCALVKHSYGMSLEELGHIESDDTVSQCARRRSPLLVDVPTAKSARNIERIARRVVALHGAPPPVVMSANLWEELPFRRPTLYEVLGVTRSASDEELRRAYKKQRDLFAAGSVAVEAFFDAEAQRAEQARIDEAQDTLLDPIKRRAYDLSTFPEAEGSVIEAPLARPVLAREQLMMQGELLREIGPDTDFTGALLRRVRESQGVELSEVSTRTKISRAHLEALEEEAFDRLPAPVYVRGFVSELAKYLRLDPSQVQRTYLRRMRERVAP
jgi:flagellar biosynthesis protein FlhG